MITHKIKRGFDLRLIGQSERTLVDASEPVLVAVQADDFPGIKPKLSVREGDQVRTGQPLFFDKQDPDRQFVSPATGSVTAVVRGERRRLLRVEITPAAADEFFDGPRVDQTASREDLIRALKQSGLWSLVRQRPFGTTPDGSQAPAAIYINGMDTEPLAADPAFAVQGRGDDLQAGVELLKKLTDGKVYLTLRAGESATELTGLQGVEAHAFDGPHPAGLVGTHIHVIQPLRAEESAWFLKAQELALLGSWARTGQYPAHRVVALAGEGAQDRRYYRIREGASMVTLTGGTPAGDALRVISGTVLNGAAVGGQGFVGYYAATVTIIPDGEEERDMFGWALPQPGKVTASRSVCMLPKGRKEFHIDARVHGGQRPIVNIGQWDKVMPLDIIPSYLLRAIQANDLEEAVNLGLLEVCEEDMALCTFVDPSKIDLGAIVRQGLDLYQAEG